MLLIDYTRDGIDAGCMVSFYIKSLGSPNNVVFTASYFTDKGTQSAKIYPILVNNEKWSFEWIVPIECKDGSFVTFSVEALNSIKTYGNQYWFDPHGGYMRV